MAPNAENVYSLVLSESLLSLAVNHGVICEAAVTPPISELQVLKGLSSLHQLSDHR